MHPWFQSTSLFFAQAELCAIRSVRVRRRCAWMSLDSAGICCSEL